jgi:hypothetical protein
MEVQMTQEDRARERAEKHVREVRDFFYHLMVYVLVCAMLVFIDLRQGGLDWAFWVIFGWGFGIAGHAIYVFFGDYRVEKLYAEEKNRESGGH